MVDDFVCSDGHNVVSFLERNEGGALGAVCGCHCLCGESQHSLSSVNGDDGARAYRDDNGGFVFSSFVVHAKQTVVSSAFGAFCDALDAYSIRWVVLVLFRVSHALRIRMEIGRIPKGGRNLRALCDARRVRGLPLAFVEPSYLWRSALLRFRTLFRSCAAGRFGGGGCAPDQGELVSLCENVFLCACVQYEYVRTPPWGDRGMRLIF